MRLVLFGQAPFGQKVFEGLRAAGHDIALVYAPAEKKGRVDPLAASAAESGISVETPANYKGDEVCDRVAGLGADLGVLAFVTKIIPEAVIDAPRLGSICYHPSLLPKYRGGNALAWQLIRGETRGGFSIFWTDAGVDSGPILLQREIEIGSNDSAGSLYFQKIFEPSIAAMVEAVELVGQGNAPRESQNESEATHDPLCTDEHAGVSWQEPAKTTHDLVRGCDPQPGAHASFAGDMIRLYGSAPSSVVVQGAVPGEVLAVGEGGIVVQVGSGKGAGALAFAKARGRDGKQAAGEVAAALGIERGSVLENGRP